MGVNALKRSSDVMGVHTFMAGLIKDRSMSAEDVPLHIHPIPSLSRSIIVLAENGAK